MYRIAQMYGIGISADAHLVEANATEKKEHAARCVLSMNNSEN